MIGMAVAQKGFAQQSSLTLQLLLKHGSNKLEFDGLLKCNVWSCHTPCTIAEFEMTDVTKDSRFASYQLRNSDAK